MAASEPQGIWTQAGSLGTSIPFLPRGCEGNEIVDRTLAHSPLPWSSQLLRALSPCPFHDSEQGPVNLLFSEAEKQLKVSPCSLTRHHNSLTSAHTSAPGADHPRVLTLPCLP